MGEFLILILIILGLMIYFLPAWMAASRKHPQTNAITMLTLFLGWTFIGWVVAMVWASTGKDKIYKTEPVAEHVKCPHCAEEILAAAKVCKHCGRDVTPVVNASTTAR